MHHELSKNDQEGIITIYEALRRLSKDTIINAYVYLNDNKTIYFTGTGINWFAIVNKPDSMGADFYKIVFNELKYIGSEQDSGKELLIQDFDDKALWGISDLKETLNQNHYSMSDIQKEMITFIAEGVSKFGVKKVIFQENDIPTHFCIRNTAPTEILVEHFHENGYLYLDNYTLQDNGIAYKNTELYAYDTCSDEDFEKFLKTRDEYEKATKILFK